MDSITRAFAGLMVLAATGSAQPEALASEMLTAHNAVRAHAGTSPLVWSERLAILSQEWADRLLARKEFIHRPNSTLGENLFEIEGGTASPEQVVASWAAESRNYDYKSNRCHGVCGHYTQIVWGTTREIGCAVARNGRREVWVCDYDPPGNWVGKRPY